MSERSFQADVIIAGGGLAGIVTAYELLDQGKKVLLIDKDTKERFGGLAKESFGGVTLIDTPPQRKSRIRDNPELAFEDWLECARFGCDDHWPRAWARFYCDNSIEYLFEFLTHKKIEFLPIVNWPERGLFRDHNRVPRWHIAWGTGYEIIFRLVNALEAHPNRKRLEMLFDHEVNGVDMCGGRASGFRGKNMIEKRDFRAQGEQLVIASGGICGGDLSQVRAHWPSGWGAPPKMLLNGAHDYGDGLLHDQVQSLGGNLTHLDKQWHYPAGIHRPGNRRANDGISLVPPRSALWMNARGERIGPTPLVGNTDTRFLVEQICRQPGQYSWQLMNRKIALKELAVSGCDYMTDFRYTKKLAIARHLFFGNKELVNRLTRECPGDIVVANTLPALVEKMNERGVDGFQVDLKKLEYAIKEYDQQIDSGPDHHQDDQLQRLKTFRAYRGDRIRTCNFQKILDPRALPLMAIREFILARKSLGGIQTDLECRVLRTDGTPIPGLYAVGEAAGFGGGGINGLGSLEGTFLGGCVLTGRVAGKAIAGKTIHQAIEGV